MCEEVSRVKSEIDLVGYAFMEAYSCSILKGKVGSARHIGQNVLSTKTMVSGPGNNHTHVGVDIVVCLGRW